MKHLIKTTLTTSILMFLLWLSWLPYTQAASPLKLVSNLQESAKAAHLNQKPIVIFYTATWCRYCKRLEQNIIDPLLLNTQIEDYADFRQVVLDNDKASIIDFDGKTYKMKDYAAVKGVRFVPTTMVYNREGNAIAEPILGLTLEEFYPGNLERAINQGLKAINSPKRLDIYQLVNERSEP